MPTLYSTAEKIRASIIRYRVAFGIAGIVAVIVGIVILVQPRFVGNLAAILVGLYALVAGAIYLGLGLFTKDMGSWPRAARIVVGAVFIVGGILALVNMNTTTTVLVTVIATVVGIMWIVEGVVTLTLAVTASPNGWVIGYAVVSIAAGVLVLISPFMFAAAINWLLGISFIVLGVVQLLRGFQFGPLVEIHVPAEIEEITKIN